MAEFIYAYDLDGGERRTKSFKSASAFGVNVPVVLSSGKIQAAASGTTSGVVGVSGVAATGANQDVEVITNRRAVFKCEYTGSVKTSLSDSDIGTSFDYDPTTNKLDLDDTTDGWLTVVAYNNEGKYAWVTIADGVRAL